MPSSSLTLRHLATAVCVALTLAAFVPVHAHAAAPTTAPASAARPANPAAVAAARGDDQMLYDVELVVFRAVQTGPTEDWNVAPLGRGFGAQPAQSSAQPPAGPDVVRLLASRDYRLDGVVQGLRRSGAWQPIAHAAWLQTAPSWGTHVGVALSAVGVRVPGLAGTVYLERARLYMHLGFDVSLTASGATYRIDEMRNVRPNEKQYFDHPAFGIIAVVRPIRRGAG